MTAPEPVLEPDALMAAAAQAAGLDDFGDHRFADGLARYLAAVADDAKLDDIGRMTVAADTQLNLVNRLRIEHDLKRHPEITEQEVRPPVLITGLMRTGTTKLQHVLAADPGVLSLKFWQAINPAPFPESPAFPAGPAGPASPATAAGGRDPRIAFAEQVAAMTAEQNPVMMTVHPPLPMEAEEELYLQRLSYRSHFNGLVDFVPSYMWWVAENIGYSYDYLYRVLQYLQWQQGTDARGRPWVLKSPWHLGNLDQVRRIFPQATVVHTHRDPCEAVASTARLFNVVHTSRGNQVSAEQEGAFWLAFSAEAMRRNLRQRDELGIDVLDIPYRDVVRDVPGVVRAVYRRSGRELTAEVLAATTGWDDGHPQGRFGGNEYSLAQFGLTRQAVEAEFTDYLDRFADHLA